MRRPWYLGFFARLLIPRRDREFVLGDLDELWAGRAIQRGRWSAGVRYVSEVVRSAFVWRSGNAPPSRPLEPRRRGVLSASLDDLTHALRGLRRRPRFALVVVITVALGIGPTAAVFGLMEQLLMRPLPGVPYQQTAAHLELINDEGQRRRFSPAEFEAIRARATLLEGVASYGMFLPVISIEGERIRQIAASSIEGDFFAVLGVTASSGRLLSAAETGLDADPFVTVLSERLRDDLFGPGTDAVGRTVVLDGRPFTVIGIAADGFFDVGENDALAWVPLAANVTLYGRDRERVRAAATTLHAYYLARPRPGVSAREAEAQIQEIVDRNREATPPEVGGERAVRVSMVEGLWPPPSGREQAQSMVRMMAWAVAFILAIACANVANLLLFRNATLKKVFLTRRALGASRARIIRQQLAETLVLAAGGAIAGIGVAYLIALPFEGYGLQFLAALDGLVVDWSMIGFLTVVSLASALLFGVVPAILAGRADPSIMLRTTGVESGVDGVLRAALSTGQLALTLALVVSGLLMLRTVQNLRAVDTGVDVDRVIRVTTGSSLSPREFFRLPDEERHVLQRRLLTALEDVPEVEAAALDHYGPYLPSMTAFASAEAISVEPLRTSMRPVTPGWFELFGLRILHGRSFSDSDWQPSGSSGVVLTASLARRLYGRSDVVGRTLLAGNVATSMTELTVLGVVDDLRSPRNPYRNIDQLFVTYDHFGDPDQWSAMVRVRRFDADVARRLEDAAATVLPPELYIHEPLSVPGLEEIRVQEILVGRLLWILCALSVLLSGVGLFAGIAFVVSQRNRELGIRVALGAERSDVVGLVMRSTAFVVAGGAVLGLAGAYALSRIIQSRLYEVTPLDGPSYAAAALILAAVTTAACFLPVRTALRTDPAATLRQE